MSDPAKDKRVRAYRKEYREYLDKKIPLLHKKGYRGVAARLKADADWSMRD